MNDSDQRTGRKLSTKRGRSYQNQPSSRLDRSPSKLTRLFRGASNSVGPSATSHAPPETLAEAEENSPYIQDNRRNAILLDVAPEELRPPSAASSASTSRFSIVSPPSPSIDYLNNSLINSPVEQGQTLDTLIRSSSKRFLPKIRDHLSGSSKPQKLFGLKRKNRRASYHWNGEPLDGEEGELIDDEACFMEGRVALGMDILRMLPDELSIYILLYVDLQAIVSCLRVSRHWQRLANDSIIWRAIYFNAGFAVDGHAIRQLEFASPQRRSSTAPSSPVAPSSPPMSSLVRLAQYIPSYPASIRTSVGSFGTHNSLESNIQFVRHDPNLSPAPLSLDWKGMYRNRLEIEQRLLVAEPHRTELFGHKDAVYCVEFDGEKIVTGSRDQTICVWSIKGGKPKMTLRGHTASVLCLQLDHTGLMVSGSSDRTVIVWDLNAEPDKYIIDVLKEHTEGVLDIKMDVKWIVSCSKDTLIWIWDRATRKPFKKLAGHDGPVNAIGLQNDKVASVSGDGKMILWDILTGERIRTFEGHERGLACIAYKGNILISGSHDKKIKVWDVLSGECLKTFPGHDRLVRSLSFEAGTMRIVSVSYDRSVRIWDIRTGKHREFANVHDSHILDVVSRVSKVISVSHEGKVVIMDFAPDMDTSLFA